jgi:hypothetical protein
MADAAAVKPGIVRYRGRSMWPLFQEGDLLEIEEASTGELRRGDCLVYRKGSGGIVVHRLVSVRPELRTRGDAWPDVDDEPVLPAWIMGRVAGRIRFGRCTMVAGGLRGVWAGRFYRVAGRLDPARNARGGSVARAIRSCLGRMTAYFVRQKSYASTPAAGHFLTVGRRIVGFYDTHDGAWRLPWPWSLLIDPERLHPPGSHMPRQN